MNINTNRRLCDKVWPPVWIFMLATIKQLVACNIICVFMNIQTDLNSSLGVIEIFSYSPLCTCRDRRWPFLWTGRTSILEIWKLEISLLKSHRPLYWSFRINRDRQSTWKIITSKVGMSLLLIGKVRELDRMEWGCKNIDKRGK